jgi:hypothetical protein
LLPSLNDLSSSANYTPDLLEMLRWIALSAITNFFTFVLRLSLSEDGYCKGVASSRENHA